MLREMISCEVCGASKLPTVLNLGKHPMCDDLVAIGDSRKCKTYPIEILFCDQCITAHQRFQIDKRELFPQTYHYRARHTVDVLNGMRSLVASYEKKYGVLSNKKVLDIGCNDGSLLTFFAEKNAQTYGIEPTGAFKEASSKHTIINDFFCEAVAQDVARQFGAFDVISFTNVFAHIENLAEVIRALKLVMHENTIIIIENHYLGAIIDRFQFDTFYHEHPRSYSFTSFSYIAKSLGLQIGDIEFPARYNGNIRIFYVPQKHAVNPDQWQSLFVKEKAFGHQLQKMAAQIKPWCEKKQEYLNHQIKLHGRINAKSFPGRASIPLNMLQLDSEAIQATYEKPLSAKIGHYVPGTRIPILSDNDFDLSSTAPLLNLAWHISDEVKNYMRDRGYQGPIIDLISQEDFL